MASSTAPLAALRIGFNPEPSLAPNALGREVPHGGFASIHWGAHGSPQVSVPGYGPVVLTQVELQIAHAALHYGRVLAVWADPDGRPRLFAGVGAAAGRMVNDPSLEEFAFDEWIIAGRTPVPLIIWPWRIKSVADVTPDVIHVSTLRAGKSGRLFSMLDMPFAGSQFLPPVSSLVAIAALAPALSPPDRARFARVLVGMNAYYGVAKNAAPGWRTRLRGEFPEERAFEAILPDLIALRP